MQLTLTAIGPAIVDTITHPIDLTEFDVVLVNTSAGKDSLVMVDELARLARLQGVTDRLVAVHADLGRSEWPGTRQLAQRQCDTAGMPLHVVRRSDGADLLDLVERRGMWPSAAARYCTSDLKRAPIRKLMTALARRPHRLVVRVRNLRRPASRPLCIDTNAGPPDPPRAAHTRQGAHLYPSDICVGRECGPRVARPVETGVPLIEFFGKHRGEHPKSGSRVIPRNDKRSIERGGRQHGRHRQRQRREGEPRLDSSQTSNRSNISSMHTL